MNLRSWNLVTLPQSREGVALRILPKLNIALACNQIRHVISKPHSLLSKVFAGKYGNGHVENIFHNMSNASWRLGGISWVSDIESRHLHWQVGHKKCISLSSKFWWHPSGQLRQNQTKVKDLMMPSANGQQWDMLAISKLLSQGPV